MHAVMFKINKLWSSTLTHVTAAAGLFSSTTTLDSSFCSAALISSTTNEETRCEKLRINTFKVPTSSGRHSKNTPHTHLCAECGSLVPRSSCEQPAPGRLLHERTTVEQSMHTSWPASCCSPGSNWPSACPLLQVESQPRPEEKQAK